MVIFRIAHSSCKLSRTPSIVDLTLGGEKWFLRGAIPSLSTRRASGFLLPALHTLEIRDKTYGPDGWFGVGLLDELRQIVSRAPGGPDPIPLPLKILRIPHRAEDEWLKRHVPIVEVSDPMNVSSVDAFYQESDSFPAPIGGGGTGTFDDTIEHLHWPQRLYGPEVRTGPGIAPLEFLANSWASIELTPTLRPQDRIDRPPL